MSSRKLEYGRGDAIAERYEVIDLLDESPLGISYRCKHLKTGNYVRLQLLRPRTAGPDQKDEILAVYKRAKEINHANLIRIGELGEADGVAFYTMEDFEGTTLREYLTQARLENRPLDLKEAAQIAIGVLEGVAAANDAGVVFRALRPEYVLVNIRQAGPRRQNSVAQIKLVGAAFWDLVPGALLAEDEFGRGEAQYLAPELKGFEPVATPRSDVYSAAVMFYEMLVGAAPVGTFQLPRTRRPELPVHVDGIAELALATAPEDRYPTAHDLVVDLQRTFSETADGDASTGGRLSPIAMGLGLALVVLVAVIVFNLRPDPAAQAEALDSQARATAAAGLTLPSPEEFKAVLARHPRNMVYVPAGPFVKGRLHGESRELTREGEPLAELVNVPGFLIDAFEFPNLRGEVPRIQVTRAEAAGLCQAEGKRLCTSDEWEKACKGPKNLNYAYGDTYDEEFCGPGLEAAYAAGGRPDCKSGYGVLDLSGNFGEWTSTQVPGKDRYIVKGGLKANPERGTRCAQATDLSAGLADATTTFRCCRDADAAPVPPAAPPAAPAP